MASRGLIALISVTTISVVLCWFVLGQRYATASLEQQQGGLVFPELQSQLADVTEIYITRASGSFVLNRDEETWLNNGLGGYPVKKQLVERAIAALAGLRYLAPKTNREALFHKLHVEEVDTASKSTRMVLRNSNGVTLADVVIGKPKDRSTSQQALYIRPVSQDRAWLADGVIDVRYDAEEWSDRNIVSIDAKSLSNLEIRHADGELIALRRADRGKMTLAQLPVDVQIRHQHQIDFVAGLLEGVRFDDAERVDDATGYSETEYEVIAKTLNHLAVSIRAGKPEEDGSIWVQLSAQLSDSSQASDTVKQEVNRINNDFGDWKVRLPRKFTDRLKIRLSDIIETTITNNRSLQ